MDEHFADDDLRALRAADPAAGVDAPRSLHDRVAALPDEAASAEAAHVETTPAAPVPLRPRRRWLLPVAAAGMVVAAIGGGYAWGAGGVDLGPAPVPLAVATGTPDDPAAPIGLGTGAAADGSTGSEADGTAAGPQVMVEAQAGGGLSMSTDMAYGPGVLYPFGGPFSRQRFVVPAFETASAHTSVYAVDAGAQYSPDDASRMAAALGVSGDVQPTEFEAGWVVGDYARAYFTLSVGGWAHFGGGIPDAVVVCEATATELYGRNGPGFGQEMIRCMADTPLPSDDLVQESVSMFLAAIGIDEEATQVTVTPDESARTVMVTAARIVAGNVTEIAAHITVSAQGIMYASGPTGEIVSLGDYAIVSPAEAAARLNDPAFSPRLVSWPDDDAEIPTYTAPTAPPAVPAPGTAVPWPVIEHEIVSARLGLALVSGPDGVQLLAPAYEFSAADDTVWSVIALADDELDTTSTAPRWSWWW